MPSTIGSLKFQGYRQGFQEGTHSWVTQIRKTLKKQFVDLVAGKTNQVSSKIGFFSSFIWLGRSRNSCCGVFQKPKVTLHHSLI
jgi:hypothetical protein